MHFLQYKKHNLQFLLMQCYFIFTQSMELFCYNLPSYIMYNGNLQKQIIYNTHLHSNDILLLLMRKCSLLRYKHLRGKI